MRCKSGIEIENVLPESPADKAGVQPGDILLSVNSHPLRDAIDFMFFKSAARLVVEFSRNEVKHRVQIKTDEGGDFGVTIRPFKVRTCRNNCIFCFVKQLPKGLRKHLYVKDEDYRLSFLYGNYMTLSNIDSADRKRIVDQRLSPLYISVHTTNKSLRNRMIGNPRASDIMKELKFFAGKKIRMHAQIVLCPGFNDGAELQNTIKDLYKFYPYVLSVAVVPVGLTMHRKQQLSPVTREDAQRTIEIVEPFRKRFTKKHGDPIVYCSDEMYIKADIPFPNLKNYGSLPQIENGVGMVPLFLSQSRKVRVPKTIPQNVSFLTFTGTSFYPFLKKFADRLLGKENISVAVIPVENHYFGTTVTVAGLLTGRDIIKSLQDNTDSYKVLLVPDTALKEDEDIFLDNVSLKDVEEAIGLKAVRTEATPQGMIDAIEGLTAETR
jgi:putative radical SAM enzyme (TIGR03279 family)